MGPYRVPVAKKKSGQPISRTFADLVRELPLRATNSGRIIPSLVGRKAFTDSEGIRWKRRGTDFVEGKELAKLLRNPAILVRHEYMGEITDLPLPDREAFWAEAETRMAGSVHSEFFGSEYKNDDNLHLLVIHEYC